MIAANIQEILDRWAITPITDAESARFQAEERAFQNHEGAQS